MCTDTETLDTHAGLWKSRVLLLNTLSMLALMLWIIVAFPVPADRGIGFYASFLAPPVFVGATVFSWRRWRAAENELKKYGVMTHRPNQDEGGTL